MSVSSLGHIWNDRFSINSKNAHETRPSANASSISDFKSYVILLYTVVKSGHPLEHISVVDLGDPDPTVVIHIGRLSSMMSTRHTWVVFSLFHWDAWQSLYGIRKNSIETTYSSKPIWYPTSFVESCSNGTKIIFSMFYNYFRFGCSRLLLTERFYLHISENTFVA